MLLQLTLEGLAADSSTESHIEHKANGNLFDQSVYVNGRKLYARFLSFSLTYFELPQ
jgi:hypothetical protein